MNYERFKIKCNEKGYSPSALLTSLGISKGNVSKWKGGINPSYDTLIKLSEVLECSVGYLMDLEDEANNPGPAIRPELRNLKETSFRTISLENVEKFIDKKYLDEIILFVNANVYFLYSIAEDKFVPENPNRTSAEISKRGYDILLGIFDHVNTHALLITIQLQISKIILYNLNITADTEIPSQFLKQKVKFILEGIIFDSDMNNCAFNFSDLLALGEMFDKSLYYMFTGLE